MLALCAGIIGLFLDQIPAPESLRTLHLPQTLTDNAFIFITNQLRHVVSLNIGTCMPSVYCLPLHSTLVLIVAL